MIDLCNAVPCRVKSVLVEEIRTLEEKTKEKFGAGDLNLDLNLDRIMVTQGKETPERRTLDDEAGYMSSTWSSIKSHVHGRIVGWY